MTEHIEEEITIKEIILKTKGWFSFFLKRWYIIGLAGLIGSAIGFTYAYMDKPEYVATLTFALEDEKSGGSGLSGALGLASQFGIDLGGSAGGAFSGGNLVEFMKSRSLVERTLLEEIEINQKKTTLAEYYLDFTEWRKGWEENPRLANVKFLPGSDRSKYTLQQDSILGLMYRTLMDGHLLVGQRDKKISIINIDMKSRSEIFSKNFVEILAKVTSDFYIKNKTTKSATNVAILQKQADSIRGELNAAISGVASSNDNTYNLNPAMNVKRVPSARRQIDVQANTTILTQLVANLELAKVSLRKETPFIQIIDRPIYPLKKNKLGKLKALINGGLFGAFAMIIFLAGRKWLRKTLGSKQVIHS